MDEYALVYSNAARQDLRAIAAFMVGGGASTESARRYIERIEAICKNLALMPERGKARPDILPGLRIVTHARRTAIAYTVADRSIMILRVFHAGQDSEALLKP